MNKNNSVKNNFIYQVLFIGVTMVIPLVVTPFLTRALLEYKIGEFTYSRSITSYFVSFSMVGIVKYGQRLVSQNRDDELKLRKSFWSLYYIHALFSILGLVSYILAVLFIVENKNLYWIQSIYVASALFDITWLYYGLEEFRGVVIRMLLLK